MPSVFGVELRKIRQYEQPDSLRFVFDTSDVVDYKVVIYSNPDRLVIDLKNTRSRDGFSFQSSSDRIKGIRYAKRGKGTRFVVDTKTKPKIKSEFLLAPAGRYGHRLVVELSTPIATSLDPAKQKKRDGVNEDSNYRDVKVIIDPGHGGEDPGAIGPNNIYEKKVVLDLARKLERKINAEVGFSAELSRNRDYYVELAKRSQGAWDKKADCFISLHADAFSSPKVSGASVYILSDKASSDSAKYLADMANQSDLVGGVEKISMLNPSDPTGLMELSDRDHDAQKLLTEMLVGEVSKDSEELASSILGELKVAKVKLHKKSVEKAAFVVLKKADMVSVLVETGFISNRREAKMLNQKAHQNKLATAITKGIKKHFLKGSNAPRFSLIKARNEGVDYSVTKGDTLSEISSKYNVPVRVIKQINGLRNDRIRVDQVLKIPPSGI